MAQPRIDEFPAEDRPVAMSNARSAASGLVKT
jgi:hypothetical protein